MSRRIKLSNPSRARRLFQARVVLAVVVMLTLITLLGVRLVYLQIINHEHFTTLSQDNRVRIQPVAPTRGLIFDRNGVLLAENLTSYRLDLVPEEIADLDATIARLSQIINIRPQDVERFHLQRRRHRLFDAIPLVYRLSEEELARFAVNRSHFPGVEIRADLARHYPFGEATAHVIGYVGAIDERDMQRIDQSQYLGTTHIGKTGIEANYEDELHGQVGHEQVEVNAQGRVLRSLRNEPPQPGKNLYLSLDIRLQQVAMQALGSRSGAIVAIEPHTGEVLALASSPTYDANLFVNGIDGATYHALNSDPTRPLFNRAISGQYPPGSTLKPFLGLADLDLGQPLGSDGIYCPGYFQLEGSERRYRDWKRYGHGRTDLHKAVAESCDVYFYQLSLKLGIDRMHDYLSRFGFGDSTGIDLPGERDGLLPSREWKRRIRGESWYLGETLITSIGQGFTLATPLQLAQAVATMARRGERIAPRIVKIVVDPVEGTHRRLTPVPDGQIKIREPQIWRRIIAAMGDVVTGPRGTARAIGQNADYSIAGKTGTAQVFSIGAEEEYDAEELARHLHDHALFIAFAPIEDPRIAVAVIIEHGGSGSATAAPIARRIMDQYLLAQTP